MIIENKTDLERRKLEMLEAFDDLECEEILNLEEYVRGRYYFDYKLAYLEKAIELFGSGFCE